MNQIDDIEDLMNTEIDDFGKIKESEYNESTDDIDIMNMKINAPLFKVGDVVYVEDHPDTAYVVNGSFIVEDTMIRLYDVSPIYNVDKDNLTCGESALEFQYHDKQWAEYFAEGTTIGNGLADWRGKIYNFYIFYGEVSKYSRGKLDIELMEKYNNHTIPPRFMEHILKSHSVWDRMDEVLRRSGNRKKLMEMFGLYESEVYDMEDDVRKKINIANINDIEYGDRGKLPRDIADGTLTKDELKFVDAVMKLDTEKKDHYPAQLTYSNIMKAIAEAYENASKIGDDIKMQPSLDRRTGETKAPVRGQRRYRGESTTYNLTIEFWYDLDLNVIATAYPIEQNKKVKKN